MSSSYVKISETSVILEGMLALLMVSYAASRKRKSTQASDVFRASRKDVGLRIPNTPRPSRILTGY